MPTPSKKKKTSRNKPPQIWSANSQTTQGPRVDVYQRLLSRFFETLVILFALGQTRGKHSVPRETDTNKSTRRRRLLDNLSYICDFKKGGETTTSVGLEDHPDRYNFWVASNQKSHEIFEFLTNAVADVRCIIPLKDQQRTLSIQQFIKKCVVFAKKRIVKEAKILQNAIEKCKLRLIEDGQPMDLVLTEWLQKFDVNGDNFALCSLAYEHRKSTEMKEIEKRINVSRDESSHSITAEDYERVRHQLGRLAHHIRAPMEIIEDSSHLQDLFVEYSVCQVPNLTSTPRPVADSLTTLPSMLKRMLPAKDSLLSTYEASLTRMDHMFGIHDRVMAEYQRESQQCVHSEIQVHEHFYKNNLHFVDNDRYIGCSKPACYCCHLYIHNHPFQCVEPETHRKIYLNWGLPLLKYGRDDPDFMAQRDILNKMKQTISKEALSQIYEKATGPRWHPDSQTGITKSKMSEVIRASIPNPLDEELDEEFARLTIEPDGPNSDNETIASQLDTSIADLSDFSNDETIRYNSDSGDKDGSSSDSDTLRGARL